MKTKASLIHPPSITPRTKAETEQANTTRWTQIGPYQPKTSLKPIRQPSDTSTKHGNKLDIRQTIPPNPATVPPNIPPSASPPLHKGRAHRKEHTQILRLSCQRPSPDTKSRGNGVEKWHQTALGQKRPARRTAPRNDERTPKQSKQDRKFEPLQLSHLGNNGREEAEALRRRMVEWWMNQLYIKDSRPCSCMCEVTWEWCAEVTPNGPRSEATSSPHGAQKRRTNTKKSKQDRRLEPLQLTHLGNDGGGGDPPENGGEVDEPATYKRFPTAFVKLRKWVWLGSGKYEMTGWLELDCWRVFFYLRPVLTVSRKSPEIVSYPCI